MELKDDGSNLVVLRNATKNISNLVVSPDVVEEDDIVPSRVDQPDVYWRRPRSVTEQVSYYFSV